ncbi:LOW QUALITY PROTEIN: F-box/WD repeat-containing protein 10-like [Rhynochetos jubatus]
MPRGMYGHQQKLLIVWDRHPPTLVIAVDRGGRGGRPPGMRFRPQNTKSLIQEVSDADDKSPTSLADQDDTVVPASLQTHSNVNPSKDLFHCLPPHLSMYILGLLDQKSLDACTAVSRCWAFLAKQVKRERAYRSIIQKEILYLQRAWNPQLHAGIQRRLNGRFHTLKMNRVDRVTSTGLFQGLCPRRAVSNYAKTVNVTIPRLNEEGDVIQVKDRDRGSKTKNVAWEQPSFLHYAGRSCTLDVPCQHFLSLLKKEGNLQAAYHDLQIDTIQLEERNVFCGSYNTRVLTDQSDRSRIIHYSGGNLVAIGSADGQVRLLGMSEMKEVSPPLSGHAGSIKALFLNEKKGFVLSASFDLSIRCWNISSGACVKIFNGHYGTITCLDLHKKRFVSGARDGMVKVWNLDSGKCLKTLNHSSAVWVVKMDGTRIVSGCDRGLVKVWCADTGTLIKTLEGHKGAVKCLSFDQWHLVTGSTNGYVLGWSMLGNLKRCLIAFYHPKEVLSLEFLYLRVISGCADGKIRIFNYLTGSCLKVLMANSRGDPISSFYVAENSDGYLGMVVNSPTSLLMFQFEDVRWDYTLDADREKVGKKKQHNRASSRKLPHPQRAPCHAVGQAQPLALETQDAGQLTLSRRTRHQSPKGRGFCKPSVFYCATFVPFQKAGTHRKALLIQCLNYLLEKALESHRTPAFRIWHHWEMQFHMSRHLLNGNTVMLVFEIGTPCYELVKSAADQQQQPFLQIEKAFRTQAEQQNKLFLPGTEQPRAFASGKSTRVRFAGILADTVSRLQNTCESAPVSSSIKHTPKIREEREHQQHCPGEVQIHKTPLQYKKDQTVQLQRVKLHSDSLTVERIPVPFERKMLQLKKKNSLHGPTVQSSIPAPSVVRPKTHCGLLQEKQDHGARQSSSSHRRRVQLIDPCTASSELIRSTRTMIAQTKNEATSRRKRLFWLYAGDPSCSDSGFRLLTGKQKEAYEAAIVAQYQAQQAKLVEDQQRAHKKAWLRKIKGLPGLFTGEGKTAAPELGLNAFI